MFNKKCNKFNVYLFGTFYELINPLLNHQLSELRTNRSINVFNENKFSKLHNVIKRQSKLRYKSVHSLLFQDRDGELSSADTDIYLPLPPTPYPKLKT